MRAPIALAATTCLLLAACQGGKVLVPTPSHRPGTPTNVAASSEPTATPAPSQAPSAAPTLAPAQLLQHPPTAFQTVAGTLQIDASYIVAQGAGNIVASGGGNIVAAGGGNFISHNGSAVLVRGGAIVAQGGGNIIAQGGGNFVGHNGGAIVAGGGGNYRLNAADAPPAIGTMLPAAGMALGVRDLSTGKPVPLGIDGAGQPVYQVLTNAAGHYEVYLPDSLANNFMVEMRAPKDDPRLVYDQIQPPKAAAAAVDEDTAVTTRFLLASYKGRLRGVLQHFVDFAAKQKTDPSADVTRDTQQVVGNLAHIGYDLLPDSVKDGAVTAMTTFRNIAMASEVGLLDADPARQQANIDRLANRLAEFYLSQDQIGAIPVKAIDALGQTAVQGPDGHDAHALDVFTGVMRTLRGRAATLMQASPQAPAFMARPPFSTSKPTILKAVDVPEFVVTTFLASDTFDLDQVAAALDALGLPEDQANDIKLRAFEADNGFGYEIYLLLGKPDFVAKLKTATQDALKP